MADLKLLMIAAAYKPSWVYGGPTISVSTLCEAFAANGIAVTVLTTNANGKDDFKYSNETIHTIRGVEVIYCRRITGDPMSVSPAHTWALIKRIRRYDLVHINGWWNWVAMMSLVVCKIWGVPHMLTTRGALSEFTFKTKHSKRTKSFLHQVLFKRMLKSTLLHVTSEEEARKFRQALPVSDMVVLPNIVNIPTPCERRKSDNEALNLIFLGRIDPVKNLELLIGTLNQVSFPYTLTLVGEGKLEYVEAILDLAHDRSRFSILGGVYDQRKHQLLADADLLVLLSHSENFGNVVIESLAQGTPVLLSENVGVSAWVKENKLGWVITPDTAKCAEVLNEIYLNRKHLEERRQHIFQMIQRDFSTPVLVSRYIHECYQRINPKFINREAIAKIV